MNIKLVNIKRGIIKTVMFFSLCAGLFYGVLITFAKIIKELIEQERKEKELSEEAVAEEPKSKTHTGFTGVTCADCGGKLHYYNGRSDLVKCANCENIFSIEADVTFYTTNLSNPSDGYEDEDEYDDDYDDFT